MIYDLKYQLLVGRIFQMFFTMFLSKRETWRPGMVFLNSLEEHPLSKAVFLRESICLRSLRRIPERPFNKTLILKTIKSNTL